MSKNNQKKNKSERYNARSNKFTKVLALFLSVVMCLGGMTYLILALLGLL